MSTEDRDEENVDYGPPDDDPITYDAADDSAGRGRQLLGLFTIIVVTVTGLVFATYRLGVREGGKDEPPVIVADAGPEKIEPDEPGGLEIPHQDKLVYDRVSGEESETVENLLPESEEPIEVAGLREATPGADSGDALDELIRSTAVDEDSTDSASGDTVNVADASEVISEISPSVIDTQPAPTPERVVETILDVPDEKETPEAAELPAQPASTGSVSATSGAFVVQVGSFKGAELAVAGWERLKQKNEDLMPEMRPDVKVVDLGAEKGVWYRLRIGPFADKNSAASMCNALQARNQGCFVTKP